MATLIYINPDPSTQSRATALGCGWMAATPAQYVQVVAGRVPCAIVAGNGSVTVLPEPTTPQAVSTAAQPILTAEAAANTAAATATANAQTIQQHAQSALTANTTFLAIASPTTAQVATQAKALTRQVNGLLRLMLGQLQDVSDS